MSKSTTVLAIKPSSGSETQKITPHLLPCAIKHSGSIGPVSSSYWNPLNSGDGKQTSYFRGRKLTGKTVSLPAGYKGVVVVASTAEQQKEDEMVESEPKIVDLEKDESETLEVEGEFDEVVVWAVEGGGGGSEVIGDDNVYVRGVEEWVKVAGAVHGFGGGGGGEEKEVSSS